MLDLEGVAGAKQLKAAGYTATAIQEAAAGAIGAWDLRLAGYSHPGCTAAGSSSSSSSSSRVPPLQARAQALTLPLPSKPMTLPAASGGSSGSSGVAELIRELHHTAPGLGMMQPAHSIEYFRQGIKPVMHMEAERDMPKAMLGSRKQVRCSSALE